MRFLPLVSAALVLSAHTAVAQDATRVVTANYPLQYFAERLLGDSAEVDFPVPADVDPSFWRPSISDISAVQSADLIVLNGAGFATWVDRVSLPRSKIVNSTAAVEDQFIVTESITHSHGEGEEHSHEGLASYTWLDPNLGSAQAQAVAAAIGARGLAPADEVETRLAGLQTEFEALDQAAQSALAGHAGTTFIATHPRYQYFARRYDVTVSSLEWEAGAMPTEEELAGLESLLNETGAKVLLWEAMPPEAAFEATASMGLVNVVFPTLAHSLGDRTFPQAYLDAMEDLSTALAE